jgi:glucose/arabinose dehydrogenase
MKYILTLCSLFIFGKMIFAQNIIQLGEVGNGFVKPVDIASNNNDENLYIVEQRGTIQILNPKTKLKQETFLDLRSKVNSSGNEQGMLGLAFHPNYNQNGYLFINYTSGSNTIISRFKAVDGKANITTEKVLLTISQPFTNHNAGDLAFGPDGFLYIPLGDGGSGGDPGNRSQNPINLLGKMLRIDINTETQSYLIPITNPYAGKTSPLPEIWASGLRNPWRISFDRLTGDQWIADVGQNVAEEINVEPANSAGGLNYGWKCLEGASNYATSFCVNNVSSLIAPVHVYRHDTNVGCSITGGFVYRGKLFPGLFGKYIYGDYCSGYIWTLTKNGNSYQNTLSTIIRINEISSFGEDINGEVYMTGHATGKIYRVQDGSSSAPQLIAEYLEITPNPVENELIIKSSTIFKSKIELKIIDINGKVVYTESISNGNLPNSIDVQKLSNGFYYLQLESGIQQQSIKFLKL